MLEILPIILILGFCLLKARTDEILKNNWQFQDEIRAELRKLKEDSENRYSKVLDQIKDLETVVSNSGDLTRDRIDYHLDPSEEQIAVKNKILERRVKTWS